LSSPGRPRATAADTWLSLEVSEHETGDGSHLPTQLLEVTGPFRVSLTTVAAHWFAAPASTFTSRCSPCRLPVASFREPKPIPIAPLVDFDSSLERFSRLARSAPPSSREDCASRAPSTEFFCPSAHERREHLLHHQLAPVPDADLPQPLRSASAVLTTLTVCSALARPQVSLGNTHGLSSFRASPALPGASPSLA
jgi:hypothetical protein